MSSPLDRIEAAAKRFPPNGAGAFMVDDVLALVAVARAAEKVESWHPQHQGWASPHWHPQHREAILGLREALSRLGGAAGNEAA